jgi:hypothetical protein
VVIGSTTAPAVSTSILGLNGNLEIYDQAAGAGINLIDSTYSDFFVGLDVNGDFRISEGITNRMSYDISAAHWNILGKASVTNSLHVGGSAAPAYELQVTGSGEMVSLEVSAANSGFMRWRKDGASHFYIGKGTGGSDTISISNSLGDIYFSSNGSNMRLNSNGLGVGTSADSSYALKVSGRIYSDEGLTVVNSTAGTTHLPHTDGNAYLTYKSDKTFTIRTYNGSSHATVASFNSTGELYVAGSGTVTSGYVLEANGAIKATDYLATSDRRVKKNIKPIENALGTVEALQPVSFEWRSNGKKKWGFIAQDIQKVEEIKEIVVEGGDGYLGLNHSDFSAIAIGAIQELSARVKELESLLDCMSRG